MAEALQYIEKVKSLLAQKAQQQQESKEGEEQQNQNQQGKSNNKNKKYLFATKEEFQSLCSSADVPTLIIDKAWDRSGKGVKFQRVEDVCWLLLNSGDGATKSQQQQQDSSSSNATAASASAAGESVALLPSAVENCSVVKFYRSFLVGSSYFTEKEWNEEFLPILCSPLPMALRVHNQSESKRIAAHLLLDNNKLVKVIKPVFSSSSSSSSSCSSSIDAYSCSNEEYRNAHEEKDISRSAHSAGCLSFQELVSMLPVASLGIEPHHRCFDMCAAPGSKSLQVLDSLNNNHRKTNINNNNPNLPPQVSSGVVICNEKQPTKARQILPARMKKYHSLHSIITCCDATRLPWLVRQPVSSSNSSSSSSSATSASGGGGGEGGGGGGWRAFEKQQQLHQEQGRFSNLQESNKYTYNEDVIDPRVYFDRIVCDVPCSGDGTVRKDRSVFGTWSINYVKELTQIQLSIARRGAGFLDIGGRMCYSTCSMNPLEDEHIVFQLLCMSKGALDLVDVNQELDKQLSSSSSSSSGSSGFKLKSRGGVSLDEIYSSSSSTEQQEQEAEGETDEVLKSLSLDAVIDKLPPGSRPSSREEAVAVAQKIARCVLRVLPHRNDTGGFFLALFEKKHQTLQTLPNPKKYQLWSGRKRFELVDPQDQEWKGVCEGFGLFDSGAATDSETFRNSILTKRQRENQQREGERQKFASKSLPNHALVVVWTGNKNTKQQKQSEDEQLVGEEKEEEEAPRVLVPVWHISPTGQRKRINFATTKAAEIIFGSLHAGGASEVVNFGVRAFEKMQDGYMKESVKQRYRAVTEAAELWSHVATKRNWTIDLTSSSSSSSSNNQNQQQQKEEEEEVVQKQQREFVIQLLSTGFHTFSSTTELAKILPDALPSSSSSSSSSAQIEAGSFLITFIIPSPVNNNCSVTTSSSSSWCCAAMLTAAGKIDLLVEFSSRRLILEAFFGISLPYMDNKLKDSKRTQKHQEKATRRKREGATGGGGKKSKDQEEDDDVEEFDPNDEDPDLDDDDDAEDF